MLTLCLGCVLLVPLDWTVELGIAPSMLIQGVRGTMLLVFTWYILRTGVGLASHGFQIGHSLTFICVLIAVHAIVSASPVWDLYQSVRVLYWISAAVVAYRLALIGHLDVQILAKWMHGLILLGSILTIGYIFSPQVERYDDANAYMIVWCIPILLLNERTKRTIYLVGLGVIAIIVTVKRGAIVALALSAAAYGLAEVHPRISARRFTVLILVSLLAATIAAAGILLKWDLLVERFSDTSGSGRSSWYSVIFEHWWQADTWHFVCGFGPDSCQDLSAQVYGSTRGIAAHSDWLGFAHDYGLLGICCLLWLHLQFLHLLRRVRQVARPLFPALLMGYAIMFLVNVYSGVFLSPMALFPGVLLGVASAYLRQASQRNWSASGPLVGTPAVAF
jgi:hypothetical protein